MLSFFLKLLLFFNRACSVPCRHVEETELLLHLPTTAQPPPDACSPRVLGVSAADSTRGAAGGGDRARSGSRALEAPPAAAAAGAAHSRAGRGQRCPGQPRRAAPSRAEWLRAGPRRAERFRAEAGLTAPNLGEPFRVVPWGRSRPNTSNRFSRLCSRRLVSYSPAPAMCPCGVFLGFKILIKKKKKALLQCITILNL